jgi:uncharacterized protein YjiS (DUF1127 family)
MYAHIYGKAVVVQRPTLLRRLETMAIAVFDRLLAWQEQAHSQDMLSRLDDRMLRDIGVDRDAVQRERPPSFWH